MRGNAPQDLEKEVVYGRLHGKDPGGPPMPRRGDKYIVFGLVGGVVVGAGVGSLFGHLISYFIAMIAGAFVGGFLGTLIGDWFRKRAEKGGEKAGGACGTWGGVSKSLLFRFLYGRHINRRAYGHTPLP